MKERVKGIIIGILIGALLVPTAFATVSTITKELSYNNIKITLDDKEIKPTDASGNYVEPFIMDGTTYLPVRGIASALGLDVAWDGNTNTVKLSSEKKSEPSTSGITKVGDVVFNEDGIKITLTAIEDGNTIVTYRFLVENETDGVVWIRMTDVSENDFMTGSGFSTGDIQPGKKSSEAYYGGKGEYSKHKMDKINKLEFTARYNVGSGTEKEKLITLYFE